MRMKALEVSEQLVASLICYVTKTETSLFFKAYPPFGNQRPVSQDPIDYHHVREYLDSSSSADGFRPKVGTLSKAEWEAVCKYLDNQYLVILASLFGLFFVALYLVYIFKKEDRTRDRKRRHSSSSDEEANTIDKGKTRVSN